MAEADNTNSLTRFRQSVRSWLDDNCPLSMRSPGDSAELVRGGSRQVYHNPDSRLWLERMASQGWTVPEWPRRYGGAGLSPAEAAVLQEELARINARSALQSLDILVIGPLLLEFGTEYQKARLLPLIARGEILWCQGYSEPGAGSDLAALRTAAERDGDHFLVNGAKIWTSYAHYADWMFCLVRTNRAAPKHRGISFLLIDMASDGISTSPIHLLSGHSPFCEVHFENVRVPAEHLVGELDNGWHLAKRLLELERTMISSIGEDELGGDGLQLDALARQYGALEMPGLRAELTHQNMDDETFRLWSQRARESAQEDTLASPLKYVGTELNKRRLELAVKLMGTRGLAWAPPGYDEHEIQHTRDWLRSRANSIEGGSSEIQLNVIAKRLLSLPD